MILLIAKYCTPFSLTNCSTVFPSSLISFLFVNPIAFENFSINRIARFTDDDVKRLMANEGIVRNRKKILATIHNATQFETIKKEFESFQAYIDTLDKSNNYALVIKELRKKFKHLGPSSARIFLYSVGEDVRHVPEG